MLSEIFYLFLNMSLTGAAVSIIILLIRKIRKISKSFIYLLWFIPLIRLTIPVGMTSKYSIMNLLSKHFIKTVVVYEGKYIPEITFANTFQLAKRYFPVEYKTNLLENVFQASSVVWIIISVSAIIAVLILYIFTHYEIKEAVLYRDNIYFSDRITSPALYGIFRPKILVPADISQEELNYVVFHEKVHEARRDNLWRCIAILVCCLHWFNPVCWICLKYFYEDMELSCDNKVLKKLSEAQIKEYAHVILNMAASKSMVSSAFGGARIKDRMKNILSYRKLTIISSVAFTALIVAIFIVLLTNSSV